MYYRNDIQFNTRDGLTLRGWFYSPNNQKEKMPGIIMTHGFSALKEHYLSKFAEVFAEAGMCVLVYDNRNFGESDCDVAFEADPDTQITDLRDALTFMSGLPLIDPKKMGLWGTSFSGGHALVVAATDRRVACVVAQVPFVKGHHAYLKENRPELWEVMKKKYATDRKMRAGGKQPMMTPVVTEDPEKAAVMKQPSAYDFFTGIPEWKNQVTLRSVEKAGDYCPMDSISAISPTPLLFIVADHDTVCITELAMEAYGKAGSPKALVMVPGEHFAPFHDAFDVCSKKACDWFQQTWGLGT